MPAKTQLPAPGLLDPEETDRPFGRREVRRELLGSLAVLAGLFLLVCLVAGTRESAVGVLGARMREGLKIVFGLPVAFLIPATVIWLGVEMFIGRTRRWSAMRIFGLFFTVWAISGLLALPGAGGEEPRPETFERAGMLGVFLVENRGLGLVSQFGSVGTALMLCGLLLVGLVMTTNSAISAMVAKVRRSGTEESDASEPEAEPLPEAKKSTRRKKQAVAEAEPVAPAKPDVPVAADEEPAPRGHKRGFLARLFGGRRHDEIERARILVPRDEPTGWDDPVDEDVAAAARALEQHEWEARVAGRRLRVADKEDPLIYDETEDEFEAAGIEYNEDAEELQAALRELEEQIATEEESESLDEEEEEAEEEIVFQDHSGPLPITTGNPANVGEGLAKLFPSRWPKEGTPASAKKESAEEIMDKSEARMFRRTEAGAAAPEEDFDEDPLFNEEFDTRPHGPKGTPQQIELLKAQEEEDHSVPEGYLMPQIEFLDDPPQVDARMTREEVLEMSQTLVQTLVDFGIDGKVTEVHQGPVVTRFEFRPAAGIKVSRIVGLEHDIAMSMRAISVRILAPIPGKNAVGIEVPNKKRQGVYLKELISCEEFWNGAGALNFALGKTIDGTPYFADLAKMPHLLIAGATGAGKSVCLNTIICSLLYRNRPDQVRLIMVDPKRVELSVYGDIPHLLAPVVCEPKCAASALEWAVEQMEERYKQLVALGVRNIDGYNRIAANPEKHAKSRGRKIKPMPYMVIVVDELADLMLVAKADVEESIQRLAQMARAVGIHLILATQRPSVNVITGIIKANFPSRIAFQVSQKVDSRTILDMNGAEALLGKGDMLFSKGGAGKPIRIQGAFLSDDEVERIAEHCREQMPPHYEVEEFEAKLSEKEQRELAKMMGAADFDDLEAQERMVRGTNKVMGKVTAGMFVPHDGGSARAGDEEIDEALVRAAARLILETRKASVSLLQRRLKVGFARAGRLMDMLEEMGVVGEFKGSKPRDIIVDCEAALLELDKLEAALAQGRSVDEIAERPERSSAPVEEYEDEEEETDELGDEYEDPDDPDAPWPEEEEDR
ncbi:MAG: segregation ATPase FtsK/SpoIIIE, family [Candidatus Sumerlaeota bacterium]|nr:segregation ATPase FtsK/SpoIIIE, family [Candidatus Sumerlaeota bacterium]